ncbi:alpha/beta hydrolase [Pseudomonas sp. SWRI102]|uniref:Alpha/beta hydrolase n=1 Tax=Pseudomonas marvdashtae TaxID=2745500 RepID=A0A923FSM0_9PSED|nr:alpha/beta hydrolase [Pseudomonas marvdashtae]MBV4554544.1 alpha/beta hydrolase [Pseudomonas marvdashtae]
MAYPLSQAMSAFIDKTLGFTSPDDSLAGSRQAYSQMCRAFTPPRPPTLAVEDLQLAGVAIRAYHPRMAPPLAGWPCMLYLHGGGWVVGDLDSHDFICMELAAELGALVLAVDYRLAPEHPFPAGFEDCFAVWCHLADAPFAIDPRRRVVVGDSAGGNLAAALCLALRDAGRPLPKAQVLVYPALGGPAHLPSRNECFDAPLLSSDDLQRYDALYLQSAQPSAYAAPLLADDLGGLPPALIAVAQWDPLRDDGVLYSERLNAAGVTSELYVGEGLVHGCLRGRNQVPEVDQLYRTLLAYLADTL